ncbi:ubiquitin-60S ribosomal protein L40-like [Sparus aurata]|nr:ubiquitin-60S ribosomal protein L40-like [Sparus aurata]
MIKITVHGVRGEKVKINLCNTEEQMKSMTVRQLKEKITERFPDTSGWSYLRLIFMDKMLDDDGDLLSGYGIQHESVIHMVMKVPGGGHGPGKGDGGMGDKEGKNRSMEKLSLF